MGYPVLMMDVTVWHPMMNLETIQSYLNEMYLVINERIAHDERYADLSKEELDNMDN